MNYKVTSVLLFSVLIMFFVVSCGQENKSETKLNNDNLENKIEGKPAKDEKQRGDRRIPVEALLIKSRKVEQKVPFSGIVKPVHSVDIAAEVSGKIIRINKKLGDKVTTKDILAVIDDKIPLGQYKQAKAQLLSADNNLKIAKLNHKSDKELLEKGDISRLAYEKSSLAVKNSEANRLSAIANLSLREKRYNDTRVMSPIDGLISRRYVDIGSMLMNNMPVYRVVDISEVKIEIGLAQNMINRIYVNSHAKVKVSALENLTFEGNVRFISPEADVKTGTFATEIYVKNTVDKLIRAGMTAKVEIILTDNLVHIVVPDYSVVKKNGQNFIYKITDNIARLTEISISKIYGSQIVIDKGLANGDMIVVVGMKRLGKETKVSVETVN
jgi:RND family efflux transporter MFP subunit